MTLYVNGEEDAFWHWCKNCEKYPSNIESTTTERPVHDLCPECYENESNKNCEGKRDDSSPVGIVVG